MSADVRGSLTGLGVVTQKKNQKIKQETKRKAVPTAPPAEGASTAAAHKPRENIRGGRISERGFEQAARSARDAIQTAHRPREFQSLPALPPTSFISVRRDSSCPSLMSADSREEKRARENSDHSVRLQQPADVPHQRTVLH